MKIYGLHLVQICSERHAAEVGCCGRVALGSIGPLALPLPAAGAATLVCVPGSAPCAPASEQPAPTHRTPNANQHRGRAMAVTSPEGDRARHHAPGR